MKAQKLAHPKLTEVFRTIEHFVKFHSSTLNKPNVPGSTEINRPNRRMRSMIERGVKVGKNSTTTKHKLKNGALKRARVTFF